MKTEKNDYEITDVNKNKNKRKSVAITDGFEPKKERLANGDPTSSSKTSLAVKDHENPGLKMMMGMGYKVGEGLGLKHQGIQEPISANAQQSRRGIGLREQDSAIVKPDTVWYQGMDVASSEGDIVVTLKGERLFSGSSDLIEPKAIGEKLISIDEETRYCDPKLLSEMLKCKTMLDQHTIFMDGRSRSNPYEKIGKGIFLNRAAMKMANMDSVTKGLFTATNDNETLFFADICAGPGGFTEYMLWRRPLNSCGFGFTLKVMNDFKLKDIVCGPVECFHPSYGHCDDGDIFNEENLRKFQQEVFNSTNEIGVHTVLADGGFSVEGQENIQEILSKQLYLCQFLCAINILREGGNFLCKLFDTFTEFSVGLIFIVSVLFRKVSILKPITSRPANSERYIIFHDFLSQSETLEEIRNHLYEVNKKLNASKNEKEDVLRVVSRKALKRDVDFTKFIRDINDRILRQQIIALAKLNAFIVDRNLIEERQLDIRCEALELWNVPDTGRDQFVSFKAPLSIIGLVNVDERNYYGCLKPAATKAITPLTEVELLKEKFVVRNHYAGFVSRSISDLKQATYVVIKDKRLVRWYEAGAGKPPNKLNEIGKKWLLALPSFTILLVHFGIEYRGSKGNLKCNCITVVDAVAIYSEDISSLPYPERMDKVANLCRLLDPKRNGHIKPIEFFQLSNIFNHLREKLTMKKAKGVPIQNMVNETESDHYFPPGKLLIINFVKEPWMVALSRSSGNQYYFNVKTRQSTTEQPADIHASYSESAIHEVDWTGQADGLHYDNFLNIIAKKL